MYDAETDIGLVAESQAQAGNNRKRLTSALFAGFKGGAYTFPNGKIGPILKGIEFSGKEFFFDKEVLTHQRTGGVPLVGTNGRCWPMPSGASDGPYGGSITRWTTLNGSPCNLRVRNNSQRVEDIEFRSRLFVLDPTGEGPDGPSAVPNPPHARTKVGIEVEGHAPPATGMVTVTRCTFTDFYYGVRTLDGYYDPAGVFVPYSNNADNSLLDACVFFSCGSCFRSENPQSVCWTIRDPAIGYWGGAGLRPCIVADMPWGGKVVVERVSGNHPRLTVFELGTPSPNTNRFTCRDLHWDQVPGAGNYLKLLRYTGDVNDLRTKKIHLEVTGHANNMEASPLPDTTKLLEVPAGFPLDNIYVRDITELYY